MEASTASTLESAVALMRAQTSMLKMGIAAEQNAVGILGQGVANTQAAAESATQSPPGPGKGQVVDVSA
ncbi:MAG: hypothetical protein K9H25_17905 [Rhodospirillum sp.]|nr:hypothetical protein [Rhodospirillum sp.]MCF8489160.1 hypothetical protein [Rhodospirillum sp.]MCF8499827.1 hypothetical protein [Rhodospirillum sp.]